MARGLKAGDVLVLVRQRGPLFEAIIRALKDAGVPVAGADRLVLTEHIAVMDLMALADALLLPEDDLALASVLKSPLFGLDRGAVVRRSPGTAKARCAPSLRGKAADDAAFAEADRALEALARMARARDAVRLLCACARRRRAAAPASSRGSGRRPTTRSTNSSISRSTTSSARRRRCRASSPGCARAQSEVRRDMEMARDEVRVMTVHGAKGLEANTVILADTTTDPKGSHPPKLLDARGRRGGLGQAQAGRRRRASPPRARVSTTRRATNIAACSTSR